uniref:Sulfotransferase domain-containing protein n=1 Tax=viral metagenome TaxID=1070528 RepID=A0A6C0ADQ6_9ZZZZ
MTIIFVHIPKTAGTSVLELISNNPNYKIIGHYPKLIDNKIFINNSIIKDENSFCIVRNPYDRFLSAYNYLYHGGNKTNLDLSYQEIILSMSFEDFINNLEEYIFLIIHFVPQYVFVCEGDEILTKICKFENLKNDLIKIDFVFENLEHLNKSEHIFNLNAYLKEKIYKIYEKDFLLFGYDK